jgi:spore coat polysaccharide biosynthesis predicted glycosyltransferase SpsG
VFAICIEASHARGMGHLYRMLSFSKYLEKQNEDFLFLVNNNNKTHDIITEKNIPYEVIDLNDYSSNWEDIIIKKYNVKYWLDDRLNTDHRHSSNVKNANAKLITFDDLGNGAKYCDINICGLFVDTDDIEGKIVLKGVEYLVLNDEIDQYKRERQSIRHILVTLGGSDTYGVTIKLLKILQQLNIRATIHVGPFFDHMEELTEILTEDYKVIRNLKSLVKEFSKYDLAITGGGITPFEANASGLPCLIIANEDFEVPNGQILEKIGSSKFLGLHTHISDGAIEKISELNINRMSLRGISSLNTKAVEKIYGRIINL